MAKPIKIWDGSEWQEVAGLPGTNGTNGTDGAGVAAGGSQYNILQKSSSTDYDTAWSSTVSADATIPTDTTKSATQAGYVGMPQVTNPSSPYTLSLSDAGKHIYMTTTGRTITIPANSSVAFDEGTTIVIINGSGVTTTISINTDTLYLAGAGTTGSRTLAAFGMATAVKISSTAWIISGTGLS